jgi:hypothetical protein
VLARIVGFSLGEIAGRVLHEDDLGCLVAEAKGLAVDRRIDGAIRLYVFAESQTLCS